MTTRIRIIFLLCILCTTLIIGLGGVWWASSLLHQSQEEGKYIVSRMVTTSAHSSSQAQFESATQSMQVSVLKQGQFITLDALHGAQGSVQVIQSNGTIKIQLGEDFLSKDGPDLYLYLSEKQDIANYALGVSNINRTLNLGKLSQLRGAQIYEITVAEWEQYNYALIIWCRAFNVQFSNAILNE